MNHFQFQEYSHGVLIVYTNPHGFSRIQDDVNLRSDENCYLIIDFKIAKTILFETLFNTS